MTIHELKERLREELVRIIGPSVFFAYGHDKPEIENGDVKINLEDIDVVLEKRTFICKNVRIVLHIKNSIEKQIVDKRMSGWFRCNGEEVSIVDIKPID